MSSTSKPSAARIVFIALLIVFVLSTVAATSLTSSVMALYPGNQSSVAKNLNSTSGNATTGTSASNTTK